MSGYYSLPRVRLNKKEDVKKLNNFSNAYSRLFYKQRAKDLDFHIASIAAQKVTAQNEPLNDDVKNFLWTTSDYRQEIQSGIGLYVMRRKHNEASFGCKLDPIENYVWRKEDPLELLFKDVSNFDAQNPVIGSLLREIDVGKKDTLSNFLKKAPNVNDVVLKHRFERLKKKDESYNRGDNDGDDNNIDGGLGPLPSPPRFNFPTAPPLSPLPNNINFEPRLEPSPSPLPNEPAPPPYHLFARKDAATGPITPGENIMSEIEWVIVKEKKESEEVIPDDPLLEYFDKATDVSDLNYQLQKEQDERELEQFKRDYNLDKLVDEIDNGQVPEQLEFYYEGENENFFRQLLSLSPTPASADFLNVISSDFRMEILRQNRLGIHTETRNLY